MIPLIYNIQNKQTQVRQNVEEWFPGTMRKGGRDQGVTVNVRDIFWWR